LYDRTVVKPFLRLTHQLSHFDDRFVDGFINAVGRFGWNIGEYKAWFDQRVVDRAVNMLASIIRASGSQLRKLQTGIIQQYLLVVAVFTLVLVLLLQA